MYPVLLSEAPTGSQSLWVTPQPPHRLRRCLFLSHSSWGPAGLTTLITTSQHTPAGGCQKSTHPGLESKGARWRRPENKAGKGRLSCWVHFPRTQDLTSLPEHHVMVQTYYFGWFQKCGKKPMPTLKLKCQDCHSSQYKKGLKGSETSVGLDALCKVRRHTDD